MLDIGSRVFTDKNEGTQYLFPARLVCLFHYLAIARLARVVVPGDTASCHPAWREVETDVFGGDGL